MTVTSHMYLFKHEAISHTPYQVRTDPEYSTCRKNMSNDIGYSTGCRSLVPYKARCAVQA